MCLWLVIFSGGKLWHRGIVGGAMRNGFFLMFFWGFSHGVSLGVNVVLGVHVCVLPCQVVRFWFIETVLAVVIVAVHGNALAMACLFCLCWKVRVHSA